MIGRDNHIARAVADVGAETVQRWKARGDALVARVDEQRRQVLAGRAAKAASKQAKVVLLRQMSDLVPAAAQGLVPCTRGCSHCCHMATMLTEAEAEVIARETGAKLAVPARFNDFSGSLQRRYEGVPCTFLAGGESAIYAQRPIACRLHVTVADDNTRCKIEPGRPVRSPTINLMEYDAAVVEAVGGAAVRYADVREFFPQGLGR